MRSGLREPRFNDHPDRGCSLHPRCLECPRALCRYDDPLPSGCPVDPGIAVRDENIRRQRALGASVWMLAQEFGLSKWTINRITAGLPAKGE